MKTILKDVIFIMIISNMNDIPVINQLMKFAEDLQKIYKSEKEKKMELDAAYEQLKKYAEALNKTILELKEANKKLKKQVEIEEREKLIQRKLIQENKMTSLGTLASGIAHEINNPINFLLANSQTLLEIWKDAEKIFQKYYESQGNFFLGGISFSEIKETVSQILMGNIEGALRVGNLISGLRDYSRQTDSQLTGKISINTVINFAITILNKQINKYTDSFSLELGKNIPEALGNAQQIEQVIINVVQNALQALPDRKSVIYLSSFFDKKSRLVKIKVKDEGVGIPKDILGNIMEPFFTTKKDEEGTGLGLYISYSIIKKHHGALDITSEPGKGTEVIISLPAAVKGYKL